MKIWKRNAIIATVLLFVCAGIYLNWSYNDVTAQADLTETLEDTVLGEDALVSTGVGDALYAAATEDLAAADTAADYFAEVRLSRQEARDSALTLLQEAMSYESGESSGTAATALENVVSTALAEAQIESLVIAKGYADCVAYMTDTGISIAVSAPEEGLDAASVAQIADVVTSQSDYSVADIHLIEVK